MKSLTAEHSFGRTKQLIPLADIMTSETESVLDVEWAVFDRQLAISDHIISHGLKNAIIVLANGEKYNFIASGARIQFAVKNGYTHIDAIVLNNTTDVLSLMIEQAKTEINYLDPSHVHIWWEE